jgi:hypothetical protein
MKKIFIFIIFISFACLTNNSQAANDSAVNFVNSALADPEASGGSTIPEPSTYALFGIGAIGMLIVLRKRKTA